MKNIFLVNQKATTSALLKSRKYLKIYTVFIILTAIALIWFIGFNWQALDPIFISFTLLIFIDIKNQFAVISILLHKKSLQTPGNTINLNKLSLFLKAIIKTKSSKFHNFSLNQLTSRSARLKLCRSLLLGAFFAPLIVLDLLYDNFPAAIFASLALIFFIAYYIVDDSILKTDFLIFEKDSE